MCNKSTKKKTTKKRKNNNNNNSNNNNNNNNKNSINNNNNNEMEVKNSSGNGDKPFSKQNQIRIKTEILQKTALLRTARVIRTIYIIPTGAFDHHNLFLISIYRHTISFDNSKIMIIIIINNNNNNKNNTILRVGLREQYYYTLVCAGTLSCLHSLLFLPPKTSARQTHIITLKPVY